MRARFVSGFEDSIVLRGSSIGYEFNVCRLSIVVRARLVDSWRFLGELGNHHHDDDDDDDTRDDDDAGGANDDGA